MLGDRKARALMIIIEKMIAGILQEYASLGEAIFKLFELAKKIYQARTEDEFQVAVSELGYSPETFRPPAVTKGVRIVKTVPVQIGGGRTTDQIVADAKKLEGRNRPGYINPDITQKNMPSGNGHKRTVVVEFFEFDHDPTTDEVRARCEEPGYGYSTYEDGLRFQEDRPEDQRERSHVFIPENPWCGAGGLPRALGLWSDAVGRELYLRYCFLGLRWPRGCLFARRRYLP